MTPFEPPSLPTVPARRLGRATWWGWVGLLLVIDLLIAAVRPLPRAELLPESAGEVREILAIARARPPNWLLLGDSVLAGDVLRDKVGGWSSQRVVDHLRMELAGHERATFEQVALDGMLPIDMLRVIRELDAVDPTARVGVVIEINPRFFSPHYARQDEPSRPWLAALGPDLAGPWGALAASWDAAGAQLRRWLPLVRHASVLRRTEIASLLAKAIETRDDRAPTDTLEGRLRILEHYRTPQMHTGSAQYVALAEILERLKNRGRQALLFATPLADAFFRGELDGRGYGEYTAALDRLIVDPAHPQIRFVSFDHPDFADDEFVDHAHLWPAGNHRLARNLLHQLGLSLRSTGDDLVYPEGVDRSPIAAIARGDSEGAPWQARLEGPEGIAVDGDGRVVIADTGNHCLREIAAGGSVVRTLAGIPGVAGKQDNIAALATLDRPRAPVFLGDEVWFLDGRRRALRRVTEERVVTARKIEGEKWNRAEDLRSAGGELYVLDRKRRIHAYDPKTNRARILVDTDEDARITAFDVAPDGRIFFTDGSSAVWEAHIDTPAHLGATPRGLLLRFANTADEVLPQGAGAFFPFGFDEIRLGKAVSLRYVSRYDGVLVADESSPRRKPELMTERVHLRFLDFKQHLVFPWLKPLVHGGGYMFNNERAEALMSNVHTGSMAIHAETATLFHLERHRSRLVALSDGLLGVAKLGNHVTPRAYAGIRDVFGLEAGRTTAQSRHPELWATRRLEPLPRRGPYFLLVLGSSMTSVSDTIGQYSLARVIENVLQPELGIREGVRLDVVQRAYRGPTIAALVRGFETVLELEIVPDVVMIEVHSGRMYSGLADDAAMLETIARIQDLAARYDTLVILLDNDAMSSDGRDGLRASGLRQRRFLALAREAGILVVDPSDTLLRDSLGVAPWGNPPFAGPHGSTWAMDLTGRAFALGSYPAIAAHLRKRVPAFARWPRGDVPPEQAPTPLVQAFSEVPGAWSELARTAPLGAIERSISGRTLTLWIDAAKLPDPELVDDPTQLAALELACLSQAIFSDPVGRVLTRVEIVVARFANYDEYGVGVTQGATELLRREYDASTLQQRLRAE